MLVQNRHCTSIWVNPANCELIQVIDQRKLPHKFVVADLRTVRDYIVAINEMYVRGAPLIGVTAAFGIYAACLEAKFKGNDYITESAEWLKSTRPTAVNLAWAVDKQMECISVFDNIDDKIYAALINAKKIAAGETENCRKIGIHGYGLI